METYEFTVPGISCKHCIHTIETELGETTGVKLVKADLDTKKVRVEFEAPATREILGNLLREINYPPEA